MDNYTTTQQNMPMPALPANSYLPINRCNLPAQILGGLTFQQYPVELLLDGMYELHKDFFDYLERMATDEERKAAFNNYMATFFSLDKNGNCGQSEKYDRIKADYQCMLRGWMFDSNNREGAVIKGWAESRFGLLPRWHKSKINSANDDSYAIYMHERTTGIYNTNAIEAQLDLLYGFCQHELKTRFPQKQHFNLFRGTDFIEQYDILSEAGNSQAILLMNNMNSLSSNKERADEFGSTVFGVDIPREKIFYFNELLDHKLQGEGEFITIGGLYKIRKMT